MTLPEFFGWFQFGVLVCWGALGVTRAVVLRTRGVKVMAADRHRNPRALAFDLLAFACLLIWAYEVVAYAWGIDFHVGPALLHRLVAGQVVFRVIGAVVASGAILLYAVALRDLGVSWRLGIDRDRPGPLVTGGVYRWTRHPIYVAFDLLFVGAFLLNGRLIFLLLAVVWIPVQHGFMIREERFLREHYGDAYGRYCTRVGRYFARRVEPL